MKIMQKKIAINNQFPNDRLQKELIAGRYLVRFFIFGFLLVFISCGEDRIAEYSLRYDGDNSNAPLLAPDTYEAAARFPASIMNDYTGKKLTQVSYYMASSPLQTSLRIYEGGTANMPGQLVYDAELTGNITQNAFNAHVLSQPLDITGDDLWLSIRFRINRQLQTIGCDPGPAAANGDWLFQLSDNQWIPYNERTPVDINWNIRGVVED